MDIYFYFGIDVIAYPNAAWIHWISKYPKSSSFSVFINKESNGFENFHYNHQHSIQSPTSILQNMRLKSLYHIIVSSDFHNMLYLLIGNIKFYDFQHFYSKSTVALSHQPTIDNTKITILIAISMIPLWLLRRTYPDLTSIFEMSGDLFLLDKKTFWYVHFVWFDYSKCDIYVNETLKTNFYYFGSRKSTGCEKKPNLHNTCKFVNC